MEYIRSQHPSIDRPIKNRILSLSAGEEFRNAPLAVAEEEIQEFMDLVKPQRRKRAGLTVANVANTISQMQTSINRY